MLQCYTFSCTFRKKSSCIKRNRNNLFDEKCLTCAQEEHLVSSIHGIHQVHSNSGETVVNSSPDHQWALVYWIYRLIHQRMGAYKVYSLVREGFSGVEIRGEGSSRTLTIKNMQKAQNRMRYQQRINTVPKWISLAILTVPGRG